MNLKEEICGRKCNFLLCLFYFSWFYDEASTFERQRAVVIDKIFVL